jgi:prepilin-type N-terminal cleavage/methylation domain-containing protein
MLRTTAKTDFMITSRFKLSGRTPRRGGFTLVEIMIGMTIGSIILAGVLSTFLMIIRSGMRSTNYSVMETETRRAFEQLGIDARMAKNFTSHFNMAGDITSFTLEIPNTDIFAPASYVTYGYDTTDNTNKYIFWNTGNAVATAVADRHILVSKVDDMKFYRYNGASALVPTSTPSDATVKHIQIYVSVKRVGVGLSATTQVIRSSAFTLRNISL